MRDDILIFGTHLGWFRCRNYLFNRIYSIITYQDDLQKYWIDKTLKEDGNQEITDSKVFKRVPHSNELSHSQQQPQVTGKEDIRMN